MEFQNRYDGFSPRVVRNIRYQASRLARSGRLPGMDKLDRLPTISGGRINLAGQDEAVFRVDGALPRTMQTISGDWCYSWSFRDVFADEVGGFVERPNTWT